MVAKITAAVVCLLLVSSLAVSVLAGCAQPAPTPAPAPATEPQVEHWRLSQETAAMDSPSGLQSARFAMEMERLSNGRIMVDVYPGSILGTNDFTADQVAAGTIEVASQYASTALDPRLDVFNVPGVGWSWEAANSIYLNEEYIALFDEIANDVGWKILGEVPCCFNKGVSNELFTPVPDKVKPLNLKSRSMLMKSDELTVKALGFIPTPMSFSDVSSGLMTGVIDVALGPAMFDMGAFVGVTKYCYDYYYRVELTPLIFSLDLWNKLSDQDRQIVMQAASIANSLGWEKAEEVELSYKSRLTTEEFGFEKVIELTEEQNFANIKAIRDQVWPELEKTIGKDVMDLCRRLATPLP